MVYYIFDLSVVSQAQVRAVLNDKAKSGLTGGIYLWVNQNNGHFYVGSTLNFYSRISSYFYLTGAYGIILKALTKYGFDSFTLVLFFLPDATKDIVLHLEQSVLDTWKPEYNIQPLANSSAGRPLSEETKAKLSAYRKGKKQSEETKAKIAASVGKGLANATYNRGNPVYLYKVHSQGLEISATFANMFRAAETLGISRSTLYYYIQNQTFKVNGLNHIISRKKNEE